RSIPGQGLVRTRYPPSLAPTGLPSLVITSASIPGNGLVPDPGFVGVAPGKGEIMMPPVSVCHHVSTIGQRSAPIFSWYHIQASGLIGSPTVPRSLSEERSWRSGHCAPHLITVRMSVGAV